MSRLSIVGALAVTMDPAERIVAEATIVVEDGRIADISAGGPPAGRVLDARGMVALPGLVNGHAHALESFCRGCGTDLGLLPWIGRTHAIMDQLDEESAYLATRLATIEMLASGTTAYLDPEVPTDARFAGMARAAADSGMRAGLTLLLEDRAGYHHWSSRTEPRLTTAEEALVARWHGAEGGRLRTWLGPSVLSAVSPEMGHAIREAADASDAGIAFHLAEVPEDRVDTMARAGLGPVAFADAAGLLGPRTVVTHGLDLQPGEVALLAERRASLVHCPASNAKLGSGVADVTGMLAAGLRVALGTDGGSSNDTYDLFGEVRLAALMQRAAARDPRALSAAAALRMATAAGADALGIPAGRLREGLAADIVLLDASATGFAPTVDLVDSLVFAAPSKAVRTVLVGGEVLVDGGRVVGLDEAALVVRAREAARAAVESAGMPWAGL